MTGATLCWRFIRDISITAAAYQCRPARRRRQRSRVAFDDEGGRHEMPRAAAKQMRWRRDAAATIADCAASTHGLALATSLRFLAAAFAISTFRCVFRAARFLADITFLSGRAYRRRIRVGRPQQQTAMKGDAVYHSGRCCRHCRHYHWL